MFPVDIINEISSPENSRSYNLRFTNDPKPVMTVFYNCVKSFSDNGLNVIVDTIFTKDIMPLDNCLNVFPDSNYPILFVHIICPVEELRRREKERGDRRIGHGENLLLKLEPQNIYDLVIDTYTNPKEECADIIIELMNDMEKHVAFKTLWMQRTERGCDILDKPLHNTIPNI